MSDVRVKFCLTNDDGMEEDIFMPPAPLIAGAHCSGLESYHDLYRSSINDADEFWRIVASELHFEQGTSKGLEWNFDSKAGDVYCKFMDGAKTNISYNCLERNIKRGLGDKIAYIFEGNEPTDTSSWTYKELHGQVVQFSAVLRSHGVKRGDVVALYLPMIPELAVAMLACARIGAMHSVVFAGFSAESLAARVVDARCRVIVTADGVFRGSKPIGLKSIADVAVGLASQEDVNVESIIMVEHLKRVTKPDGVQLPKADYTKITTVYDTEMQKCVGVESPVEWMDSESPLFLLYTSIFMNARMSKLRRSISRSVFQLNNSLSRQNSLNGLVDLPTMSNTTLVDMFATPSNFRQLRDQIRNNNELLAEVVAAFEEKAALDFHYSKALKKISIRLHKLAQSVESGIDKGWINVAEQFDIHATIHSNLGSALTEDIIQPLRSIQTNQKKTIRAADNFVEREIRKLKEKKEETQNMKRSLYILSKELEKTEKAAEREKIQPEKYSLRRKKYKEQMIRNEDEYVWQTVDLEKQRRMTENVLRKGVESMESVERQRLAHCQTALGRYKRKIETLGLNLRQMFERHSNNLELAVDSAPEDYIQTVQPSTSAVNHIILIDLFAENFGEIMSSDRRRQNLLRVSGVLDSELKRLYNNQTADVMVSNSKQISVLEFIEYLYYKVNDSINIVDGGQNRGFHRLARFQHKIKDKSGLPMTILTIPLSGDNNSLPPCVSVEASTAYSSPRGSNEYDEYEKISDDDGFYPHSTTTTATTSTAEGSKRTTTTFNEPTTPPTLCRVLYDFEPKHADEIHIREGQCVLVEDRIGDDWLIGHVISQPNNSVVDLRSGRFPTTYVTLSQ